MRDQDRKRPVSRRRARRERVDAWFLRIAWIVSALFLAWMLQQAFTMRPVEEPAIVRTVG